MPVTGAVHCIKIKYSAGIFRAKCRARISGEIKVQIHPSAELEKQESASALLHLLAIHI
jgi:hypothetical protein